jgi:hypothetical protein
MESFFGTHNIMFRLQSYDYFTRTFGNQDSNLFCLLDNLIRWISSSYMIKIDIKIFYMLLFQGALYDLDAQLK